MSAFRIALLTVAALFLSLSPRASAQGSPAGKTYKKQQQKPYYGPQQYQKPYCQPPGYPTTAPPAPLGDDQGNAGGILSNLREFYKGSIFGSSWRKSRDE